MKKIFLLLFPLFLFGNSFLNGLNKDMNLEDIFKQMDTYEYLYKGNDYLSKEDYKEIKEEIKYIRGKSKGPYSYLLYLTSTSVPKDTYLNILFSLSILQDNDIRMFSKQYLIGFPEDLEDYVKEMDILINKRFKGERNRKIRENFALKVDPRYFEKFNLKKAPALVLATCINSEPDIDQCKFHYLMRGDIGLYKFFDKIAQEDQRYELLLKLLKANKIVDKEGK